MLGSAIATQPFPFTMWLLMFIGILGYGLYTYTEPVYVNPTFSYSRKVPVPIMFWVTTIIIAWYAGNIVANDVPIYRLVYANQTSALDWAALWKNGLGDNPLFKIIRWWFWKYITTDPSTFQLLWIGTAQILFLTTYRRYSVSMRLTILMFIASGMIYFTSVAWKQSMAMSIGFMASSFALNRRWIAYYSILLVTSTIHPYILLYGIYPLFVTPNIWTKKSVLILILMLIAGLTLSSILEPALELTSDVFGDQHDSKWFSKEYSVKLERVIFFAICPTLAVIYRKRLNKYANPTMNAMIQMSVVSFGFMAMAMNGGANFISRMGNYFEPFTYVALPYILIEIVPKKSRTVILYGVIILYLIFFTFSQLKHGSIW